MAGSGTAHLRERGDVLLAAHGLSVEYSTASREKVVAVSDVSLDVLRGETLGLVGESGCGKSSICRAVMMLPGPTFGTVEFDGLDLTSLNGAALRRQRTRFQMIFQDPASSLNPRRRIRDIVAEGLAIWGSDGTDRRVDEVMDAVGLDPKRIGNRRPSELSGGQCQRVSIARALVLQPDLVVCDEAVSALDVSVQAQILNLLEDTKAQYGLTLLFVAHDLAVVKNISDRVAVMYLGKLCEVAGPDALYEDPAHPYTQSLLEAIPIPDPTRAPVPGNRSDDLPSPLDPPSGCRYRTRCARAQDRCATEEPVMRKWADGHYVACHFPGRS